MTTNKIARFAGGGDTGDGSGGTDDSPTFTFAEGNENYDYDPYADWTADENYDYDPYADWTADDSVPTDEASGTWADLGNGQWAYTDAFGNTQTYDDPDYEAPADTGEQDATWSRNPDGSMSQIRADGVIITKNNDGSITTQNPNGDTIQQDPEGDSSNLGTNPNGDIQPPTSSGGLSSVAGLAAKFQNKDGSFDWSKLLKTGMAAGLGIKALQGIGDTLQNKNATPDYQGQIDMGLQFNRTLNPQDPNRRPGSASTPFFAASKFGPAGSAPQGIAALPQAPALGGMGESTYGNAQPAAAPSMAGAVSQGAAAPAAPAMPTNAQIDTNRGNLAGAAEQAYSVFQNSANYGNNQSPEYKAYQQARDAFNQTESTAAADNLRNNYQATGTDPYADWDAIWGRPAGSTLATNLQYASPVPAATPAAAAPSAAAGPVYVGSFINPQGRKIDYDASGKHYDNGPNYAQGGIAALGYAAGGSTEPRYLRGDTDGMADEVPARIDGQQEAALAHGEFIIPADVVSHLGNGNSDAGAKKLYQMMDKLRVARTGTKQQGKEIDPDAFMPGVKGMSSGGITDAIPRYAEGGAAAATGINQWAGPYATQLLSQTNAVGNDMINSPGNYVYQGPRTAETNSLQTAAQQAAAGINVNNPNAGKAGDMMASYADQIGKMPTYQAAGVSSGYSAGPAYNATTFSTKDFNQEDAAKYMNPYLQLALDPQLEEARRQAEITRMTNAGRLVGSGAFGGGRQAIMEAEGDRNLGTNLANITGQGYNKAYDTSLSQFNADQARRLQADQYGEQSKQFGYSSGMTDRYNAANLGLQAQSINEQSRAQAAQMELNKLTSAANTASNYGNYLNSSDANARSNLGLLSSIGNDTYARDQAGITADMNRFNEEAALPGQALKFKKDMLAGLPTTTTTPISPNTSLSEQLAGLGLSVDDISKLLGTS